MISFPEEKSFTLAAVMAEIARLILKDRGVV
jgi:hypothetical protein